MSKGKINVAVENIFPLIKKFLYSDHEIFLRELISNATDATTKLTHLSSIGEIKGNIGTPKIEIKLDSKNKTLHVIDQGVGMTDVEVNKYINEVAFSGAEEFLEKYKDSQDSGIIGHFGLGFYSAFMVADKVEIITKSHTKKPAAHWTCDGSPEYTLVKSSKKERGTEIILHISKDSKEFLEESRIRELLLKYNKFMPIPIKFGSKEIDLPLPKGSPKDAKPKKETVDDIINNTNPAWTKTPKDLSDEDYNSFYRELYPSQFEPPLFNIHLNVDYPFHLTGILYFPKINNDINIQKDKIQLYQNQVFVTDNVEGIVPEFLTLLRGVIDSPDIPLNVSRSYLQADGAVKKISNYITRKVGDKLNSLFKKDRKSFEEKWNDIKVVIEYGMLSEDKFFDKADKFALYPTTTGKYYTYSELEGKIKPVQTDKDGKLIILYTNDIEDQHSYIKNAEEKGYTVLLLDSPIISHLIQKMETSKEKISFCRVDGDSIENLIKKEESIASKLNDKQKDKLKPMIEEFVKESGYMVQLEPMESKSLPFVLAQPEFMRRMKEMQQTGGGGMMGNNMPGMYTLLVNTNHELITQILETKTAKKRERLINQGMDLAKLSQGLLKGEALTKFLQRSLEFIK
ncbi:MAG: molecular chaperone HtpG [Flavobacteriaceae bacterium]|nr:molecular chaperone HtpG [Flavobacteriaceae bacterium]|tara:strand:+ start:721 stop:2601 length:1881 start_codon:yes stop_codon:yes gene_type:complete